MAWVAKDSRYQFNFSHHLFFKKSAFNKWNKKVSIPPESAHPSTSFPAYNFNLLSPPKEEDITKVKNHAKVTLNDVTF